LSSTDLRAGQCQNSAMISSIISQTPSTIQIQTEENGWQKAVSTAGGRQWDAKGVSLLLEADTNETEIVVSAPDCGFQRIRLRWRAPMSPDWTYMGDAFERGYGTFAWHHQRPEIPMPWYFFYASDRGLGGLGVACGAGSFALWRVDDRGIQLELDCRSGGVGVRAGARQLNLATIRWRDAVDGEGDLAAATAFCRLLGPETPRLPAEPVYGGNNWYYAYGRSTHDKILGDAARVASWSSAANRPWMVIDDCWQPGRSQTYTGGPWHSGNRHFPDMPGLAAGIRNAGAKPGIWYRPLLTDGFIPDNWRIRAERPKAWTDQRAFLDPTVPEVQQLLYDDMQRLVGWGYDLVKHDFSTYDLLGYWGNGYAGPWIEDGWTLHDRSRTNAEVVKDLYDLLREAAGDALLIGCNTIGHLAAGTHEIQRTGDDTSGTNWDQTRRMGVNTLAFRMAQHDTFFAVDADCVGLTRQVPWALNRQWLDVLARSGTPLFVSAEPEAVGPEQAAALKEAFAMAAQPRAVADPLDWRTTTCPSHWATADGEMTYDWFDAEDD